MAPTKERALVAQIKRVVLDRWPDAWVFKVVGHPYQESGVPDLLVCVGGRLFGLEVKLPRPGESREAALRRASAEQLVHLDRIRRAGGVADVVLSVDDALSLITRGSQCYNQSTQSPPA